jgi:hypothetical protein
MASAQTPLTAIAAMVTGSRPSRSAQKPAATHPSAPIPITANPTLPE